MPPLALGLHPSTLAATGTGADTAEVLVGACAIVALALVSWAMVERDRRRKAEAALDPLRAEMAKRGTAAARDEELFTGFQREIGALTVTKLKAEVAILEAQVKTLDGPDMAIAGREAHELMVEKTRLEIDGLRLHNAEVRRRIEDWRSGD